MRILYALLPVALVTGAPVRRANVQAGGRHHQHLATRKLVAHARRTQRRGARLPRCRRRHHGRRLQLVDPRTRRGARHRQRCGQRALQAQYGAGWQDARERDMTRLYNFFAQPTAQAEFCDTAKAVLAQLATVDSARLTDFAATNCRRWRRCSGARRTAIRRRAAEPRSSRSPPQSRLGRDLTPTFPAAVAIAPPPPI